MSRPRMCTIAFTSLLGRKSIYRLYRSLRHLLGFRLGGGDWKTRMISSTIIQIRTRRCSRTWSGAPRSWRTIPTLDWQPQRKRLSGRQYPHPGKRSNLPGSDCDEEDDYSVWCVCEEEVHKNQPPWTHQPMKRQTKWASHRLEKSSLKNNGRARSVKCLPPPFVWQAHNIVSKLSRVSLAKGVPMEYFGRTLQKSLQVRVLHLSHYHVLSSSLGLQRMYDTLHCDKYCLYKAKRSVRTSLKLLRMPWNARRQPTSAIPQAIQYQWPLEFFARKILSSLRKTSNRNQSVFIMTYR